VLEQGLEKSDVFIVESAGMALQHTPASITDGLIQVLMNENLRGTTSPNAAALATNKQSVQAMGVKLMQLYSGILMK
jgi:hypothetical protein